MDLQSLVRSLRPATSRIRARSGTRTSPAEREHCRRAGPSHTRRSVRSVSGSGHDQTRAIPGRPARRISDPTPCARHGGPTALEVMLGRHLRRVHLSSAVLYTVHEDASAGEASAGLPRLDRRPSLPRSPRFRCAGMIPLGRRGSGGRGSSNHRPGLRCSCRWWARPNTTTARAPLWRSIGYRLPIVMHQGTGHDILLTRGPSRVTSRRPSRWRAAPPAPTWVGSRSIPISLRVRRYERGRLSWTMLPWTSTRRFTEKAG